MCSFVYIPSLLLLNKLMDYFGGDFLFDHVEEAVCVCLVPENNIRGK